MSSGDTSGGAGVVGGEVRDFFVSYTAADRSWAEWIGWVLEEEGYSVVIQAWDFRPGRNFVSQMNDAAQQAERTLAVLSPAYLASEFGEAEWTAAFADDPTGKTGKLVPVRIEQFEPSGVLKPLVYVDLVELGEDEAKTVLLAGVKLRRAKPPSQPVFPGGERSVAKVVPAAPRFPGMLPGLWRVPHLRNPRFVGRATTLEWMSEELSNGGRVALYGLGGVGKTQIAVEYLYRTASDLDVVWWLRAEDPLTLVDDLAGLADGLGVPVGDSSAEAAEAVVEALRTRTGWLLVFDNATEADAIKEWLPAGESGRVVVTTRNPEFGGLASTRQVEPMDVNDATRFITDRIPSADAEQVEGLAEDLGRLPLALEQATAYIATTGRTIGDYRELLTTSRAGLLAKGASSADYPETVATTWDLAFKEVANTSPGAAELLNVAAFLAPDGIPRALFTTITEDDDVGLPDQLAEALANPLGFDDLVMTLGQYSLIDVEADIFAVHRLVQDVTRDRLDEPTPYVEAAVQLVANAFPFDLDDPTTWTATAAMLSHATTVLDQANKTDTATQNLSWLHSGVGRYLHTTAQYTPALYHLEQALAIHEASYGPDHPSVAIDLNNLAQLFQATNRYEDAEPLMHRALTITEANYGPDHPDHPSVATSLNNLASLLQATNRLEEAEPLMSRALDIDEASYGPDHPKVAIDLNNLAQLFQATSRYEEAESLMRRALTITEASYGPDHPTVAIGLNNFASLLYNTDRYEEAEPLMRRALDIDEASYGPDHPDVATDLNNLAMLFLDTDRYEEAEPLMRRALTITEASYGPDHPDVARDLNNLALLLQATNRYEEAEPLMRRALDIDEASYGPDHPDVATDLNNLALLLQATNRYEEAEPLMRRLVEILAAFTKRTGHEHPNLQAAFANYVGLLHAMGRSEEEISAAVELIQHGPDNAEG